jgi:hypothetical protein
VIRPLRRVLSLARGRHGGPTDARRALADPHAADDPARRIEAARRRLKATIPPPED